MVNINRIRWQSSAVEGTKSARKFRNSSQVFIHSSLGMLVYKEETSNVTIKVSGGGGGSLLSLFKKSVVSQVTRYDGNKDASGCKKQSTNAIYFPLGHHSKTQWVCQDCQAYDFIISKRYLKATNFCEY